MRKTAYYLLAICLMVNISTDSSAGRLVQERRKEPFLEGVVRDFVKRSPISGALVSIVETGQRATTNEKGEFQFEGLTSGSYTIRITHPQHRPQIHKNFQLSKGGGVYAGFALKSGKDSDPPLVIDNKPKGQFVIDEDAEVIEQREPVYPQTALNEKVEGTVVLWVGVGENGEVIYAWFKEGLNRKDLIEASMEAIQYFKFKPAKVKGKPVEVMVTVPFNFKLADKSSEYPFKLAKGPLTNEEIASALDYLGIQMYRFSYEVPFKHKLRLCLDQYLDGKLKDSKSTGSGTQDQGNNNVTLFKYLKNDSVQFTVSISAAGSTKRITFNKISVKGFPSSAWIPFFDVRMQSGAKTPFCVYVLHQEGLKLTPDEPVGNIISKNKFVIVASIELKLD